VFSSYQINVPQLFADIDRAKAKQLGVPLQPIYQTLQIYLGSLYVNDFNQFGRTYQVRVQADAAFRSHAEDIAQLKVRNDKGEMVPLSSLMRVKDTYGPDRVQRYNGYAAADINGGAARRVVGQAQAEMTASPTKCCRRHIVRMDRADLPGHPVRQHDDLCVPAVRAAGVPGAGRAVRKLDPAAGRDPDRADVHPVRAAGREADRWRQQRLHADRAVRAGGAGVEERDPDRGVCPRTGDHGRSIVQAALEACRLRLRPILMTSIAFIMGVVPLVFSHGAGSEMRHAMGVAVFAGMLGVTFFGLFLTPVFYVLLRTLAQRLKNQPPLLRQAAPRQRGLEGDIYENQRNCTGRRPAHGLDGHGDRADDRLRGARVQAAAVETPTAFKEAQAPAVERQPTARAGSRACPPSASRAASGGWPSTIRP
jgi:multidrug efflux pump